MPAANSSAFLPDRFPPVELASTRPASADAVFGFADVPQLARALRAGEAEAFRFLHSAWHGRIARYCFALAAGDEAFGMEIAQAVYLRIFKQVPVVPDEGALWNWTTCAMRSAAIDLRRVGGRYRRALARFADWLRFGGTGERERAREARLFSALDAALAALEPEERYVIECRYFHRESLETIGARCGATARAIEGRLARARERLREMMRNTLQKEER